MVVAAAVSRGSGIHSANFCCRAAQRNGEARNYFLYFVVPGKGFMMFGQSERVFVVKDRKEPESC